MTSSPVGRQCQIRTPDELGNVISELRSHRRKTQFEVASALGIDRSQLAHLEGGRSGRYLAHLLNILDHLGAELRIYWPAGSVDRTTSELERSFGSSSRRSSVDGKSPDPAKYPVEDAPEKPDAQAVPSTIAEPGTIAEPSTIADPTSAQLTKITNLAMNVMAASQQRSPQPRSAQPRPTQ
jgi:transcriptional regulator with XRE-family HTH domain